MLSFLSFEALAGDGSVPLLEQLTEFTLPTSPLTQLSHSGHCTPVFTASRLDMRRQGTVSMPQSPWKIFKLANPNPIYPASFLPEETTIKVPAHCSPHSPAVWWTPGLPASGPTWCAVFTSGNYKYRNEFFPVLSLDLCLAALYFTQGNMVKTQAYPHILVKK